MIVKCDGVEMPSGTTVEITLGERNQLTVRAQATSSDRFMFAALADGEVHKFEWFYEITNESGTTIAKYAEAHAKLNFRLSTKQQGGELSDFIELSGQAWGPPPNYKQILATQ